MRSICEFKIFNRSPVIAKIDKVDKSINKKLSCSEN